MFTHSVKYTAGTRTVGSNLVSIVDREDGQVFILPIFFMTSALVGKLECQVFNKVIEKMARTDEQIKLATLITCRRKLAHL